MPNLRGTAFLQRQCKALPNRQGCTELRFAGTPQPSQCGSFCIRMRIGRSVAEECRSLCRQCSRPTRRDPMYPTNSRQRCYSRALKVLQAGIGRCCFHRSDGLAMQGDRKCCIPVDQYPYPRLCPSCVQRNRCSPRRLQWSFRVSIHHCCIDVPLASVLFGFQSKQWRGQLANQETRLCWYHLRRSPERS